MTPYAQLLAAAFDDLPQSSRALHAGPGRWPGRITVRAARLAPLRWLARLAGLPPAVQDAPFELTIAVSGAQAIWTRTIGGQRMRSRQRATPDGLLAETLGPVLVQSRLVPEPDGLRLVTQGVRVLGLPVPRALWPRIEAREWQQDGCYRFDIAVSLPLGGPRLIAYTGDLDTRAHQSG